jgi:hypothetical protein
MESVGIDIELLESALQSRSWHAQKRRGAASSTDLPVALS